MINEDGSYKDDGSGMCFYRDFKNKVLIVLADQNPISGFLPRWKKEARFVTAEEWFQSTYALRAGQEAYEENAYFWDDLEMEDE
jgi:hypothetical protein